MDENAIIAGLNDRLRNGDMSLGRIVCTPGVSRIGPEMIRLLMRKVAKDTPEPGNDPFGQRDFGVVNFANEKFFWKIDYYDKSLEWGSENPADPEQTTRVLTLLLASEY